MPKNWDNLDVAMVKLCKEVAFAEDEDDDDFREAQGALIQFVLNLDARHPAFEHISMTKLAETAPTVGMMLRDHLPDVTDT